MSLGELAATRKLARNGLRGPLSWIGGNLRVWTRVEDIEPLMKRLEHMVARSNATLLAAACIVGLAVVMQFYHPKGWQGWIGAVFWIAVAIVIVDYVRTLLTLRKK